MSLLTQEHELVRKAAREFAEKHVEPIARKMDIENYYPREVIREAGKLGILTPTVPAEYGGGGGDSPRRRRRRRFFQRSPPAIK